MHEVIAVISAVYLVLLGTTIRTRGWVMGVIYNVIPIALGFWETVYSLIGGV